MAGHIHGKDGCTGCQGSRGPAGHDWEARMRTSTEMQPNIAPLIALAAVPVEEQCVGDDGLARVVQTDR
ncbi:hypothetical protein ABZ137_39865 [Streptomyces bobili]|uniref:hypothetical protein n=1 Tax=Streptomyces bobili TaxID=67280 RepID=UPI0033BE36E3